MWRCGTLTPVLSSKMSPLSMLGWLSWEIYSGDHSLPTLGLHSEYLRISNRGQLNIPV